MCTIIFAIKAFASVRAWRVCVLVLALALLLGATAWSARDLQASTETANTPRAAQCTASHASVASSAPSPSHGLYAPNSTTAADDGFGASVAISGNVVVIGAPSRDAAYVFVKPGGGWANMTQTSRLTSSETDANEFGISVSIDGTTVVVGAPMANSGKGAGYVFVMPGGGWSMPIPIGRMTNPSTSLRTSMTQSAKLTSSDADADGFAFAAISSDTITVGAPTGNGGRGAGYVFVMPGGGWSGNPAQIARLTADLFFYLPVILKLSP